MENSPMTKTLYILVAMVGVIATVLFYHDAFAGSKEEPMKLKVGDRAPDFELPSQTGEKVQLSNFQNKKNVVLYFYPKDNTAGCTTEACSFRDNLARFASNETEVIGVSLDSVESHQKFAQQHGLNFLLLSDRDQEVVKAYGVAGGVLGFKYAKRTTFLIDKAGTIRNIFLNVSVKGHSEEVLAALQKLSEASK
jgi:peroxiredoxin Q/BCP